MTKVRVRNHANPLSYPDPIKRDQWLKLKTNQISSICLDMGCGQGEVMIASAKENPSILYIGIEVRIVMCQKVNDKIKENKLTNAICLQGNASISLSSLFEKEEVDEVIINFPDPWFKERYKKRFMIQEAVVTELYDILSSDGNLYFKTDLVEIYERFNKEFEKKFISKPFPENRLKSYWEKFHESRGKQINRILFVKK